MADYKKLLKPVAHAQVLEHYNIYHRYTVFLTPCNSAVRACDNGYLLRVHDDPNHMLGKHIILLNYKNGVKYVYGYLDAIIFNQGTPVLRGEIIGLSGQTGSAKEPCLYFLAKILSSEESFEPIFEKETHEA